MPIETRVALRLDSGPLTARAKRGVVLPPRGATKSSCGGRQAGPREAARPGYYKNLGRFQSTMGSNRHSLVHSDRASVPFHPLSSPTSHPPEIFFFFPVVLRCSAGFTTLKVFFQSILFIIVPSTVICLADRHPPPHRLCFDCYYLSRARAWLLFEAGLEPVLLTLDHTGRHKRQRDGQKTRQQGWR